jgi:hypothetical protein
MLSLVRFAPLVLGVAAAAQSPAAIVTGAREDGRIPWSALGLGTGGVVAPARAGAPSPRPAASYSTAGGVLVRAAAAGVKLDFPSGAELLVAPDGIVHLRDGSHSLDPLPFLELRLADDARIGARRAPSGRHAPFDRVEVVERGVATVLWRGKSAVHERAHASPPVSDPYLVLGDGDVVYRAAALGPLLTLERVLAPAASAARHPPRWVGIAGDVLADSLQRLALQVPRHALEFPRAGDVADDLAAATPLLFPRGRVTRPSGAIGQLVFALAFDCRLLVEQRHGDRAWLALHQRGSAAPVVEWQTEPHTALQLLREGGGEPRGPRYFTRGVDVTAAAHAAWPLPRNARGTHQARRVLRLLSGGAVGVPLEAAGASRSR